MGFPRDLLSKSVQPLKRPAPPTNRELFGLDQPAPLSQERRDGLNVEGALAARYMQEAEELRARKQAREKAEKDRDAELHKIIDQRLRNVIGHGRN